MKIREISLSLAAVGALFLSACGGGGGASPASLVPAQQPVSAPRPSAAPTVASAATQGPLVQSKFVLTVPLASASSTVRHAKFVAGSTQSVSVVMLPATGTPAPAQTMNISASSPNCTSSGSTLTCTLTVLAPTGTVTFGITTYDQPNAAGNVLATGSVIGTVQANQTNTFPATLNGVPASIKLALANAYLPAGVSGSTTMTVSAVDADGNTIIGTYSTPLQFGGVHLTFSPSSMAASSSTPVSVTFDGNATTPLAVTATAGSAGGGATLTPTSNVVKFPIPTASANPVFIVQGPDGNLYFGEQGPTLPGNLPIGTVPKIGQLVPSTGSIAELSLSYQSPLGLFFTPDGALWVAEAGNTSALQGALARISPFGSSGLNEVALPPSPPQVPVAIAQLGNSLYVTQNQENAIDVVGNYTSPFGPSSITQMFFSPTGLPYGTGSRNFAGIAAGSDGNLWVAESGTAALSFAKVTTSGAITDYPIPQPTGFGAQQYTPLFVAAGSDGNLYGAASVQQTPNGSQPLGELLKLSTAGTYTTLALPTNNDAPLDIVAGQSGMLYFTDGGYNAGIGAVNATGQVQIWPVTSNPANPIDAPFGVAYATDGSLWYTERTPFGTTTGGSGAENSIGHLILASGWTVFPQGTVNVGVGAGTSVEVGVAESGDSSPFKLASPNSGTCTITAIPGFSHDFTITGVAPGTGVVSITDKNGRSVVVNVAVTATNITVQSQRRNWHGGVSR